ncbi:hypothetical protein ASPBRDRAFT_220682 [Aspergillus brasiliensis CBS 101740]|uniref:Uncharacterized protein n=1 Tax=Aspergillus brasiliensis (strain CBS 101740 / IMI 381727 / IBT 21946) TaxID=767769 RepID=A0A1L9UZ96_ASPBC|nr:hypothetical protein ASPBRDRAFT_220682 [Aspergillus brasiliensis CBS 101740]
MARKFPVDSAGPDIVRDYIIQVLIRKHEATPEYAEKLATCWQLGRVRELRDATLKHLQEDFGNDVGLCLYRSVREDMLEDWQETTAAAVTIWLVSTATMIHIVVLGLFILPELGLMTPCERILLAKSPASWLLFGFAWINYAYQRWDLEGPDSWSFAGALGLVSVIMGLWLTTV